jgi:predicted transcriptional regulator
MRAGLLKNISGNMRHRQAVAIVERLLAKGLIEADGEDCYRITPAGAEVARHHAAKEARS